MNRTIKIYVDGDAESITKLYKAIKEHAYNISDFSDIIEDIDIE